MRALFRRPARGGPRTLPRARDISVLQTNFRNTQAVTGLANRLLKIKQARFGSVDRESNFLVRCASGAAGEARLLKAEDKALRALDAPSRASVRCAVIVLRDEDKAAARAHFRTPLIFSVHEAKGLEYPNVILFQMISANRADYAEVCRDVAPGDLEGDDLDFRRYQAYAAGSVKRGEISACPTVHYMVQLYYIKCRMAEDPQPHKIPLIFYCRSQEESRCGSGCRSCRKRNVRPLEKICSGRNGVGRWECRSAVHWAAVCGRFELNCRRSGRRVC